MAGGKVLQASHCNKPQKGAWPWQVSKQGLARPGLGLVPMWPHSGRGKARRMEIARKGDREDEQREIIIDR